MTERISSCTRTFPRPFIISDVDCVLPAGTYVVETTEEQIPGLSFVAYRRLSTTICLPGVTAGDGPQRRVSRQIVTVDPKELDDACGEIAPAAG